MEQVSNKCDCEKCNSDGPGCGIKASVDWKEAFDALTRVHQNLSDKYATLLDGAEPLGCLKHGGLNQYCSMCLAETAEKIAIECRDVQARSLDAFKIAHGIAQDSPEPDSREWWKEVAQKTSFQLSQTRKLLCEIRDKCADSRKKPGCQNVTRQIYEMCAKEVGE